MYLFIKCEIYLLICKKKCNVVNYGLMRMDGKWIVNMGM